MGRQRRGPTVLHEAYTEPFRDGTEAWFWTMACLTARHDGALIRAGLSDAPRPCEPDDIILQLGRLHRDGAVSRRQLTVLAENGRRGVSPDGGRPVEARDAHLWEAAIPILERALKEREIVA